jgi:hypothetical protein
LDNVAMPRKGINWLRWLHGLGSLLAIAGVGFVILRFREYWGQLDLVVWSSVNIIRLVGLSIIYGTGTLLLALAWRHLLLFLGVNVKPRDTTRIYGVSQLARYLPGNIFHLAGRQVLGMSARIPAGILAKSTLWELGLISYTGALFSALILPVFWPAANAVFGLLIWIAAVATTTWMVTRLFGKHLNAAFLFQTVFLALSATIFVFLLAPLDRVAANSTALWPVIGGAYIVAWLIGLVTPGAPAGVGIREMVLLLLLGHAIPDTALLPAVALSRLVTVVGDVFFFLGVIVLLRKRFEEEQNTGTSNCEVIRQEQNIL